ncbi:MAG: PilZ domain-containing protein [Leptospiraceae bacterium]|nr:PilZ domain-containing protein [Leptospiraceae bacterium]
MSERRRRLALPGGLILAGSFLLILPLGNWLWIAWQLETGLFDFYRMQLALQWYEVLLWLMPFPAGVLLLRASPSGWYLAVLYAVLLISYNLVLYLRMPNAVYLFGFLQTVLVCTLVYFIVRKDISAPYMDNIPRGWRRSKRWPVRRRVLIDDTLFLTSNLSVAGLFVPANQAQYRLNQSVKVKIDDMLLEGGVVRIDHKGVGIAFRHVDNKARIALQQILAQAESQFETHFR